MRYVLLSEKKWHLPIFENLAQRNNEEWILIKDKVQFTQERIIEEQPVKIFIPHWSYIIPEEIFANFECVVFHMTDLPYGRGGSPLQNLIVRKHKETKISAVKIDEGIDTGGIYLKESLSLQGTAQEIFLRSSKIIQEMIIRIIEEAPVLKPQQGTPVVFKRRGRKDGDISELSSTGEVYDYIRMLDCEGYPNAFLETESLRFEFSSASNNEDKSIIADVRIIKK